MSPDELGQRVARLEVAVGRLDERQKATGEDVTELKTETARRMDAILTTIERMERDRRAEQHDRDTDRKRDRWTFVGTMIAFSSVIIAATGLLLNFH